MARCKFGPVVAAMSGTVGGITFKAGTASGVVTRLSRVPACNSVAQSRRRNILAIHEARWFEYGLPHLQLWTSYAAQLFRRDRFGARHVLTPHQAFMQYCALCDPDGTDASIGNNVPAGIVDRTPHITAVNFTAAALCIIWVDNYPLHPGFEWLTVRRHLEYGPRDSARRVRYVGVQLRGYDGMDWSEKLAAAGVVFVTGERIGVSLTWAGFSGSYPSTPGIAEGIVAAA